MQRREEQTGKHDHQPAQIEPAAWNEYLRCFRDPETAREGEGAAEASHGGLRQHPTKGRSLT
jgi:hypothetical protein